MGTADSAESEPTWQTVYTNMGKKTHSKSPKKKKIAEKSGPQWFHESKSFLRTGGIDFIRNGEAPNPPPFIGSNVTDIKQMLKSIHIWFYLHIFSANQLKLTTVKSVPKTLTQSESLWEV